MGLLGREKSLRIYSLLDKIYTSVTDGQTEIQTDRRMDTGRQLVPCSHTQRREVINWHRTYNEIQCGNVREERGKFLNKTYRCVRKPRKVLELKETLTICRSAPLLMSQPSLNRIMQNVP